MDGYGLVLAGEQEAMKLGYGKLLCELQIPIAVTGTW